MTTNLTGKVALITGASAGIGQACARALAEEGARLVLEQKQGTILMISSMAGVYGFGGEAVYCATKFAQVGFAQALDRELRPHGIKVGVICPGGVKTEFALGRGRTQEGGNNSDMLEPEDVAGAVLLACKQSPGSRIIEIQMRTMAESLA